LRPRDYRTFGANQPLDIAYASVDTTVMNNNEAPELTTEVHTHELCTETHIGTGSDHRWTEDHCVECGEALNPQPWPFPR
jgi:hypothetical protein